jgi:catechol 2,3-dioxygenase-like lactoylglutathione lyase family enzyme
MGMRLKEISMSETSTHAKRGGDDARKFRVTMMFHPSHHVPDLAEAEDWFERVFGRRSIPLASARRGKPLRPGVPTDYSTFTPISDVLFDSIDPKRYVLLGVQRHATVARPHLKSFGWYVDGIAEVYRELRGQGIRLLSQLDEIADGDEPPIGFGSPLPNFFSVLEDTGLRYQFFPEIPHLVDARVAPDWSVPPVSDDDPLGIERCSHHTVLTGRPERALRLVVDVLGGEVVYEGRDELRGTSGTFVHLGDSILEYAVPDVGTAAHEDWTKDDPNDTYHAITWKVADLERTERHLLAQGVRIEIRSDDTVITDPATSLGIPWGFTSQPLRVEPQASATR